MLPPQALRSALSDSVTSGVFIDTKFYLFSRRNSSGKVCRPRPIYANSLTLESVPYFKDLLSGGFTEGMMKSLDYNPFEGSDSVEDCDYLSDSDLEDDVEVEELVTENHLSEQENQSSSVGKGFRNEINHEGKVVVLRGTPYLTFRAILMYLYTGEIDFAPFGSKANHELRTPELLSTGEGTIPRPSPKSVYRVADMYDIPKLKELALAAIKNGIRSCDAVEETFSKFTSRYSEIVDLHIENLASELLSSNSQDVQERFNKKLRSFANGEIPHATNPVSTLFGILARYRAFETLPQTNTDLQGKSKCTWAEGGNHDTLPHKNSMNIALIKSMHCGSFLDMEYRVRKKWTGTDQIASIYFSSIIIQRVRSGLAVLTQTFNPIVGEGDQELDDDSDYEERPSMEIEPNGPAHKGSIPCHSFLPGALKTWKSLFLYLCFGGIKFGPLRSQSSRQGATDALSCSPKSTYHLAKLLGLDLLAYAAFYDIIHKLTPENIVVELFSEFTTHDDKLMKEQCSLLTSTLKTPETIEAVQQHIQEMASGASPHSYRALSLAFGDTINAIKHEFGKTADEEKARETKMMLRPRLRCNWPWCRCVELSINEVKAGNGSMCPTCLKSSLRCSECDLQWGGGDVCSGCKKAFR